MIERAGYIYPGDHNIKARHAEDRTDLLSVAPEDMTAASRWKLQTSICWLNIRRHFPTVRVVKQWCKLPWDLVCFTIGI